jgi:toxin ParE1/3/4
VPRLVLTPAAQADLIEIAAYIETAGGSLDTDERFADKLLDRCEELAARAVRMGRKRPELLPGLRSIAYRNYVIFFRYIGLPEAEESFEVVNTLERHRDVDAYFSRKRRG